MVVGPPVIVFDYLPTVGLFKKTHKPTSHGGDSLYEKRPVIVFYFSRNVKYG